MLLHDWDFLNMIREYRAHYNCSLQDALKVIREDLASLLSRVDKIITKRDELKEATKEPDEKGGDNNGD